MQKRFFNLFLHYFCQKENYRLCPWFQKGYAYYKTHNKLGLEYRELMEHLKDKDPSYYYTDILIPNGQTLRKFIQE